MMSGAQREDEAVEDLVAGARRVRAAVRQAMRAPDPVRLLIAGPRGSAKSAVLEMVEYTAVQEGRVFHAVAPDDDVDAIAPETIAIVDDLHALDPTIAAAVLRRAQDPRASLVAATRPSSSTVVRQTCEALESSSPALVLGRVGRADVLDHAPGVDRACVEWILEVTGGVTWLVSAALHAHDERDCADDSSHDRLSQALHESVAHRLASSDEDVKLAVDHAAADDLDSAAPDALRRAYVEGLLLRDGRAVPIVRSTVATGPVPRRLSERARSRYAIGDLDGAAALAEAGLVRADAIDRGTFAAVAASIWSSRGMLEVGSRIYDAMPAGVGGPGVIIAGFGVGRHAPSDVPPPTSPEMPSTLRIASGLLVDGLSSTLDAARIDAAVATLARASQLSTAAQSDDPFPEMPAIIAAAAAQSRGDLVTARGVIDAALAGGQGGAVARSRLLLWRAWIALHQVRARDARESLALASVSALAPREDFIAHAVRLGLARRFGDSTTLGAAWEAARPALVSVDVDLYLIQPLTEFIATGAKLRDVGATDAAVSRAGTILDRLGEPALWSVPLRWTGIQRGILLNEPDSLAPHAHALLLASASSPVAATMATAGRVWTTVLAGTADVDEVDASAVALARIGLTWDAARLAGSAAAAFTDRRASARMLARARDIHPLDGPRPGVAAPSATEALPPRELAPSGLSRRETDVARLIVEGKTYAEIGAAIFISPRTAEHHVASIRRRLGATSRSDLLAKLRSALELDAVEPRAVA